MRQERLRLMTSEEARQKQDKLRALRSHRLTDAEIDMMLAERRKVRVRVITRWLRGRVSSSP